ncbi:MAG: hypothetical protein ACHBN1_13085 [Heteroscytonema crispum UTEX LB 1556]
MGDFLRTANPTGEPVLGGKPSRSTRFTTNPFGVTLVGTLDYSKGASLSLPRSAEPVAWVGNPSGRLRAPSPPTTAPNPTGEPVAWVRKTPLAALGQTPRPQWLPYQGREVSRGESSRLQTQAPLHHQPPTNN